MLSRRSSQRKAGAKYNSESLLRSTGRATRLPRSGLVQCRKTLVPTAPTTPVLLPDDAKNCQLPSNNSQNRTSRHSLTLRLGDDPDIPSSWLMAPAESASSPAVLLTESFEIRCFLPENVPSRSEFLSKTRGHDFVPTKTAVGRSFLSEAALELVK